MFNQIVQSDIDKYKNFSYAFSEVSNFNGDKERRDKERYAFINNQEYIPNYDYPRLDLLNADNDLSIIKKEIYDAVIAIDRVKKSKKTNDDELELYSRFHESRLRKIMLIESARSLQNSTSISDVDINRICFNKLNIANFGDFDKKTYLAMISTEIQRAHECIINNPSLSVIAEQLANQLADIDTKNQKELSVIQPAIMARLSEYVTKRYQHIFMAVPYTDENVYYDANQCVEFMNKALMFGGLFELGWRVEIDPTRSNPTTSSLEKRIYLPPNTRRNASELCRLIIHEQEVHARRSENSKKFNLKPLEYGMAGYADIEEGLGVLLECAVVGNLDNSSFRRARNRYITAGLALGADGKPRDAREVFEIMWRIIAIQNAGLGQSIDVETAKDQAYAHIENAYRGTQFWVKGAIYTKLKVYYEGLVKNARFILDKIDNLDNAFEVAMLGKFDHTDHDETRLVLTILAKSVNILKPE